VFIQSSSKVSLFLTHLRQEPNGIFPVIEESCQLRTLSEAALFESLRTRCSKNQKFIPPRFGTHSDREFTIVHYMGKVNYRVSNFISKNKNVLHEKLVTTIKESRSDFVSSLFSENSGSMQALLPKTKRKVSDRVKKRKEKSSINHVLVHLSFTFKTESGKDRA